jgi:hypothetical protein
VGARAWKNESKKGKTEDRQIRRNNEINKLEERRRKTTRSNKQMKIFNQTKSKKESAPVSALAG